MAKSNVWESCSTGVGLEVYKIKWEIQNWASVQLDKQLVKNQIIKIETGKSSDVKSTLIVGLKISVDAYTYNEVIRIYWQIKELEEGIEEIAVKTSTKFLYGNGLGHSTYVKHETLKLRGQIEVPKVMSYNLSEHAWVPGGTGSWVDVNGCRNFKLELTVKLPSTKKSSQVSQSKLENYRQLSQKKFRANFAVLLNDPSSADIKIVTKDDKNLFAHKLILRAQCPVFDSMFRSKLTEDKTGIVNVDDICEKTMKIILHYFYTGSLLPTWKDNDVIVEFIYAAGKYQMEEVLDMINNGLLGEIEGSDCKMGCEMELLSMLHKLSLENAEAWLMNRIVKATNQAKSSAELLALFAVEK